MTTPFSWADTFRIAISSCLPCLQKPSLREYPSTDSRPVDNPTAHRIPRARPDELQGLLADNESEAERMSLHSNPGHGKKRAQRKKKKRITFFGYDLFGHAPPIQLPDSDDEDGRHSLGGPSSTTRSSSLTFDSDAAPLDSSTIATISTSAAALRVTEVEEGSEREERREKRRQRRELKKVAKALTGQGGFEGFQGSGDGLPSEEFGPFIQSSGKDDQDDGGDVDVDLDGAAYSRNSHNGNGSGSDSRSGTSASRSQRSEGEPAIIQIFQPRPRNELGLAEINPSPSGMRRAKLHSRSSNRPGAAHGSHSNTSGSASQSSPPASPLSPTFSGLGDVAVINPNGTQGLSDNDILPSGFRDESSSLDLRGELSSRGFPSSRLSETKAERRNSLLSKGAFLATRGGPEDID